MCPISRNPLEYRCDPVAYPRQLQQRTSEQRSRPVFHPAFSRANRVSPARVAAVLVCAPLVCAPPLARCQAGCPGLPTSSELRATLQSVVKEGSSKNGGMGNQEWAVVVNRK